MQPALRQPNHWRQGRLADFTGASFIDASIASFPMTGAKVTGAKLHFCNLNGMGMQATDILEKSGMGLVDIMGARDYSQGCSLYPRETARKQTEANIREALTKNPSLRSDALSYC